MQAETTCTLLNTTGILPIWALFNNPTDSLDRDLRLYSGDPNLRDSVLTARRLTTD